MHVNGLNLSLKRSGFEINSFTLHTQKTAHFKERMQFLVLDRIDCLLCNNHNFDVIFRLPDLIFIAFSWQIFLS
jgi:hypothetical protein